MATIPMSLRLWWIKNAFAFVYLKAKEMKTGNSHLRPALVAVDQAVKANVPEDAHSTFSYVLFPMFEEGKAVDL